MATKTATPALVAAMKNRPPVPEDRLDQLRDAVRRARDLRLKLEELERQVEDTTASITAIEQHELIDIMDQAGVPSITLAAEGNLPGYIAKAQPYHHANIAAGWPEERRQAGFDYLESQNAGDLVKREFTIVIAREDHALGKRIEAGLKKLKVEYAVKLSTPWGTLTAWLKERIEMDQVIPDLDKIGGTVGRVVKLKPLKEDK
jgi:hypothetical protein